MIDRLDFFSFPTPEMRKISVLLSLYIGLEKGTFAETTAYWDRIIHKIVFEFLSRSDFTKSGEFVFENIQTY